MASWRKKLREMAADTRPVGYTYEDATLILKRLGFDLAGTPAGSHRIWRRRRDDGTFIRIGLVQSGNGPMRREYIQDMIARLRSEGILDEGESE